MNTRFAVAALLAGTILAVPIARAAGIDAPSTADPGASVTISVAGAGAGGMLEIWGPVTTGSIGAKLGAVPVSGGGAIFNAPLQPGSYQLRYVTEAGALAAKTPFDVAAVPIVLSAPRSLSAGIDTRVEWRGPGAPGDVIQVFDPATGAVLAEAPAEGQPGALNATIIRGPEQIGTYELRYWSPTRGSALRALPVSVSKGAWLRTPIEVYVNETFSAEWKGPESAGFSYRIIDPGSGSIVSEKPADGSGMAMLKAPARAGKYRVQFVNTGSGYIAADLPLDVDAR